MPCHSHDSEPAPSAKRPSAIAEHVPLARDTYRLRLPCPAIAAQILPGQFMMFRLPGTNDPLLGRPLALYDTYRDAAGRPAGVDIVYQAIGRMTRRLATVKAGERLEIWGPLGNGFPPTETGHLIMVAGGIGQTPFLALARHYLGAGRVWPAAAGRAARRRGFALLRAADGRVYCRRGRFPPRGRRTSASAPTTARPGITGPWCELVPPLVAASELPCRIVACGPEKMLHATVETAARLGCLARFRWKARWPAASASASVA